MLRCLIADDEAPARKRLERLLAPLVDDDRVEIVGQASDGQEAIEAINAGGIDLAFLDVQMPGATGLDVLDRADPAHRPAVVFTTAYDEYAVQAFEANAVDYLLKPFSEERLEEAVARVERRLASGDVPSDGDPRLARLLDYVDGDGDGAPAQRTSARARYLSVPYRDRLLVVPVADVVTAEVQDGITRLFTRETDSHGRVTLKQHLVSHTLDALEAEFDPEAFVRVHRSALVHLAYLREMVPWFSGRYKLIMETGHEVLASRERARALKERFIS
jgi:two-component system LytT family response regulator